MHSSVVDKSTQESDLKSTEQKLELIRKLQYAISSKDEEVIIVLKGSSFGTKPYYIRCGNYEKLSENIESLVSGILSDIKKELKKKIENTENQAKNLKNILNSSCNES